MLARPVFGLVASVALIIGTSASALPLHTHRTYAPPHGVAFNHYRPTAFHRYRTNTLPHATAGSHVVSSTEEQIVAHPAGCPRTLFCGCGAARELGLSDPSLWAVKSWYRFPRAAAAPGMALIWGERHVAAIRLVHSDGTATVYDANSGGGLTRVHRISLNGLVVVDPHAGHHGEPTFASFPPAAQERTTTKAVLANEKRERVSDLKREHQND